jgi:hypothetical protein
LGRRPVARSSNRTKRAFGVFVEPRSVYRPRKRESIFPQLLRALGVEPPSRAPSATPLGGPVRDADVIAAADAAGIAMAFTGMRHFRH